MRSRVVLVRGSRAGSASGGCCSGDVRPFDEGGSHCHAPLDEDDDAVGRVYRELRAALPADVAVEVVAPSNWLWLAPELVRGGRRRGLRGAALLRSVRAGLAVESLIVDGAVLASGGFPSPREAVAAVEADLALR